MDLNEYTNALKHTNPIPLTFTVMFLGSGHALPEVYSASGCVGGKVMLGQAVGPHPET